MRIYNFETFSKNEEYSKNTPIIELFDKEKLGVVLIGLPGSGKSTFIKNVISKYQSNMKSFSTDDVSLRFSKDPNKYHLGASDINISYLKNYIKTGQNFIYDTTGSNDKSVFEIVTESKRQGYKVIFILMLVDIETAKSQNKNRFQRGGHLVDDDYIEFVYNTQLKTSKSFMKNLKPDSFYIVSNINGKYKYYKHTGKEILKRKVDKYI